MPAIQCITANESNSSAISARDCGSIEILRSRYDEDRGVACSTDVGPAERLPHDAGNVLDGPSAGCESVIVFAGEPAKDGHSKPDPIYHVEILLKLERRAHA